MPAAPTRYSSTVVVAHWLSALLIVVAFVFGLTVDLWPREQRSPWINAHALMGVTVALLVVVRLVARLVSPRLAPLPGAAFETALVKLGHGALYLAIVGAAFTGLRALFARGRGVDFGLFQIPSPFGRVQEMIEPATELHEIFAYALIALAVGHAALALYHQFVRRDGALDRMRLG